MDELKNVYGRGTELITLYVPFDRVPDATKLLRDEIGKASNIKSRTTRQAVTTSIKSCQEKLKAINVDSAIFVGNTNIGWISQAIETPKPLTGLIYRCGSEFFLDPLERMSDSGPTYAIINLDLHEVALAVLCGVHMDVLFDDESQVPSKMGRGGQSARRFEKNRKIAITAWFRKCSDKISEILLSRDIEGIVVSGPGLTKNDFVDRGYLHHELMKKVVGIVDTGYAGVQGLKEALNGSEELFTDLALVSQRKSVRAFLEVLSKDGKVTYGRQQVMANLNKSSIVLLSSEDVEIKKMAETSGTNVVIVSAEFEEGKMLRDVFGGYAALLRYS